MCVLRVGLHHYGRNNTKKKKTQTADNVILLRRKRIYEPLQDFSKTIFGNERLAFYLRTWRTPRKMSCFVRDNNISACVLKKKIIYYVYALIISYGY